MACERWIRFQAIVTTENDGASFLEHGAERTIEIMELDKALSMYGEQKLRSEYEVALIEAKMEIQEKQRRPFTG